MVGVAIVGILAAVAIPSFKGYIYRGRVTEAVTVLNEIKTRQEAYRSRFGNYAAVSGNTWGTYTPAAVPGSQPVGWPSSPAWEELGLRSPGFVRFRYATIAGFPGEGAPASTNLETQRNFGMPRRPKATSMTTEIRSFSRSIRSPATCSTALRARGDGNEQEPRLHHH